jgi:diguanylate cyclase (GGDEF)-like protein
MEAVSEYSLSSADFAHTDLTTEMLYLVEAKSAAMEESRGLITRLQGARITAEEQAFTDTLTGLKNRRALDCILARLITTGQTFAMVHLDLDYFKTVNDTLGHAAGDFVLQNVATILVDETRNDDTVARVGGDEFVLILNGLVDQREISRIVSRMIRRIEVPMLFEGHECKVSCSAGTSLSSYYTAPDLPEMFADADAALYASKRQGRACHTFFDDVLDRPDDHEDQMAS